MEEELKSTVETLSTLLKRLQYLDKQRTAWRKMEDSSLKGCHLSLYTGQGTFHVTNPETLRSIAAVCVHDLNKRISETQTDLAHVEKEPRTPDNANARRMERAGEVAQETKPGDINADEAETQRHHATGAPTGIGPVDTQVPNEPEQDDGESFRS